MTSLVFNTEINLGNLEPFKLLPDVLQDYISDYTDEGINQKLSKYDWDEIILTLGGNYGFEYIIDFINENITDINVLNEGEFNCRKYIGYSHNCKEFITCDEKLSMGFYYDEIQHKRHIWRDEAVCDEKATEIVIKKIDEYINSDSYDSSVMYRINKQLLDDYYSLTN